MLNRVSDRATFVALRTAASRARQGPVSVAYVRQDAGSEPRVAYTIPARVGPATVRNRIRRRVRAALGEMERDLAAGAYMVSARREVATMPFFELKYDLKRAIAAARIAKS